MRPEPLPHVLAIEPYKGGESKIPGIRNPIKLSSNENPLGCSPLALKAYRKEAKRLHFYPDGAWSRLRSAIHEKEGLEPGRLFCASGSDEIFLLLSRAFLTPGDEVAQNEFAFLAFRIAAQVAGAIVRSGKDPDHRADVDSILSLVNERTKIVYLANPNNPTGTYLPKKQIERLANSIPPWTLLVLDGAYAEYVDKRDYDPGYDLARRRDNVILTRTFSKIHGLAALRVGWAYGPEHVIDALNRARIPFNVSGPGLAAAEAALHDEDFARRSAEHNQSALARLTKAAQKAGFAVTPSVANFILFHMPAKSRLKAMDVDQHFKKRGLILRGVNAYGLPNALRLSVGDAEANDRVVEAFEALNAR